MVRANYELKEENSNVIAVTIKQEKIGFGIFLLDTHKKIQRKCATLLTLCVMKLRGV